MIPDPSSQTDDPDTTVPTDEKEPEAVTSGADQDKNSSVSLLSDEPQKAKTPVSVIIAGIVLTIITVMCLKVDNWGRDWTNNSAETNPDSADEDMRPINSNLSVEELGDIVKTTMSAAPGWKLIDSDSNGKEVQKIHLVHITLIMRFKDDVVVEIAETNDGCTLWAKSKSRIGKGDLGQNPRNIKDLISRTRKAIEDYEQDQKIE